jgi:hypothetical protein
MPSVDAGVDHGDEHPRQEVRQVGPVVEGLVGGEMPLLLLRERVVGREREPARAQPLDVGGARQIAEPWRSRPFDDERGERREALDLSTQRPLEPR